MSHMEKRQQQALPRVAPDQVTAEPETTPPGESETVQAVIAQDEPETANIRKDAEQEDEPIYKLTAKQTNAMPRKF